MALAKKKLKIIKKDILASLFLSNDPYPNEGDFGAFEWHCFRQQLICVTNFSLFSDLLRRMSDSKWYI